MYIHIWGVLANFVEYDEIARCLRYQIGIYKKTEYEKELNLMCI